MDWNVCAVVPTLDTATLRHAVSHQSDVVSGSGGVLLLLFNTTRAHAPDPQARGPLSLWTEVWPTQPVLTLPY
jgi:hypothetical protein